MTYVNSGVALPQEKANRRLVAAGFIQGATQPPVHWEEQEQEAALEMVPEVPAERFYEKARPDMYITPEQHIPASEEALLFAAQQGAAVMEAWEAAPVSADACQGLPNGEASQPPPPRDEERLRLKQDVAAVVAALGRQGVPSTLHEAAIVQGFAPSAASWQGEAHHAEPQAGAASASLSTRAPSSYPSPYEQEARETVSQPASCVVPQPPLRDAATEARIAAVGMAIFWAGMTAGIDDPLLPMRRKAFGNIAHIQVLLVEYEDEPPSEVCVWAHLNKKAGPFFSDLSSSLSRRYGDYLEVTLQGKGYSLRQIADLTLGELGICDSESIVLRMRSGSLKAVRC
eukprot:TRINITY_DN40973_c0_g1_i1.p1 TRINITY_DN40973_c0_g1~~TRINITY_DN40973_c0_g1_i1.p1  ORF type:complete len:343 (+),score=75.59 TRINITY_DN40973_c0_g1_i1:124-1152(+)